MLPINQFKPQTIIYCRMPEARKQCGLGPAQIYALASRDEFPRPVKLGLRASGFLQSELDSWKAYRLAKSRGKVPDDIQTWKRWHEAQLAKELEGGE